MKNFSKAIKSLKKDGYGHFSSVINKKYITEFKQNFFYLLNNLTGYNLPSSFDSNKLAEKLKLLRDKDPKKLDSFFKTIKLTSAFNKLFYNDNMLSLVSKILGINSRAVILSEMQMRLDEPKNSLYSLDWHQDSPYYPQVKSGADSIVVNIFVQNCYKNMGSVELIKGSHKNGKLRYTEKSRFSKAQQMTVSKKYLKLENLNIIEALIGDVIIYDMNLIHKSGYNMSNKVRASVIGRAFNPLSKKFTPYQYTNIELIK